MTHIPMGSPPNGELMQDHARCVTSGLVAAVALYDCEQAIQVEGLG